MNGLVVNLVALLGVGSDYRPYQALERGIMEQVWHGTVASGGVRTNLNCASGNVV